MKKLLSVIFLLLLTSKAIDAKTFRQSSDFNQLKQKITLNENESAWREATKLENEYLGDVDFDFLYGLVALKVQEHERAVYAFERVVANKPNWLDAQYYLASAYYSTKNYHAAIEITESLSQVDTISSTLKESAVNLHNISVAALDKQSLFIAQSVGVHLGYDSNINAGTSEDNIFLPFLEQDIILSDNSKEISDSYLALGYQLMASKALTQSSKLTFSGSSKLHYFSNESQYNRFFVRTNLQYKQDFEAFSTSVGVRAVPLWLDGNYYRTQYGATVGLSKTVDQQWLFSTQAFVGKSDNEINRLLNTDDASLQVSAQYSMQRWRHALSLVYSQEESEFVESQHNSKKTSAISYMANFAFNQHWLASANISYQHQAYQHEHPFFLEKQVDDMWLISTSILYKDSARWSYQLSANMQDKDSNLALFSYQRAEINLSARMSF
ncbi:DUF560 domain-containing protein [Colwellia sp. BRX10-3]|uniref:surface lipoprotein assembly modifier n=1 Tax=Colwellia sp. BRX10-3 TaxID=2759844 RepID=UPI0015F5674B|nr:surface lipoprotein assembly modifier [Colwellia sp. BRX10-3]MBA6390499.1 DUF560 domain-containing protein [Colwellia sp. BRX10-3]